MYIYYRGAYPNELWHHGVSGQKWGVKHGPPYPLKNGFLARRQEKGHHTAYEKHMARKEKHAIKKYEKLAEKRDNAKSERKKDRLDTKAAKAQAKVEMISEMGQKYSSLDAKQQKKISRGYAWTRTTSVLAAVLTAPQQTTDKDGNTHTHDSYTMFDHARTMSIADSRAANKIDQLYRENQYRTRNKK